MPTSTSCVRSFPRLRGNKVERCERSRSFGGLPFPAVRCFRPVNRFTLLPAMGAVANKTVRELSPELSARYMLAKYMLGMEEEGSCLHARSSGHDVRDLRSNTACRSQLSEARCRQDRFRGPPTDSRLSRRIIWRAKVQRLCGEPVTTDRVFVTRPHFGQLNSCATAVGSSETSLD